MRVTYPHLTKVLTELGETDLQIHSVFLLHLGCVRLLTFEDPTLSSRFPVAELEKLLASEVQQDDLLPYFHTGIIKALKKHPNIFDITILGKEPIGFVTHRRTGILISGKIFSLRVNLPEPMQTHDALYAFDAKPIEQFEVISNGSLFAAFAAIQNYPVWTHIGHEYRDLLSAQIEKETSFKSPSFGPSPIHPQFYFVFRKKRNKTPPVGTKVYTLKNDIFLVFDNNSQTNRDMAMAFFKNIKSPLLKFYSLELIRMSLINYDIEISNHFSDLSTSTKKLFATPWWRIFKSRKFAHVGRTSLPDIHKRSVEFETEFFHFNKQRNQLLSQIKQDRILSNIHSYFCSITEPDIQIPQALPHALDHFGDELRTFGNIRSVIIASLFGAAIGAALTVLLTKML